MINFNYENSFLLSSESDVATWINTVVSLENKSVGEINFIFCDDDYLLNLNQQYLNHDTLTDVISFDYSVGNEISGDIFISTERVLENSQIFETTFLNELHRVIIHGVLHYCGYKDKADADLLTMRSKENSALELFHVKHL